MSLVYYFDIGNTRMKLWCCRDGKVEARYTDTHAGNPGHLISLLPSCFMACPDAVLGASVLDEPATKLFSQACHEQWQRLPQYAHSSLHHAGVLNAYGDRAAMLGVDRWLGLIAVRDAADDICVVDCGTAITLDVLRCDGQHMGGYILPGLALMLGALRRETHRVRFDSSVPDALALGCSTAEAALHGALAAVVSLIERVAKDHAVRLVLTGGDAERVSRFVMHPHDIEPELLLRGLQRYFADAGIS